MRTLLHSAALLGLLFACVFTTANALETSRSSVRTRTGCTVVLTCAGNGTRVEWRRLGALETLEENENLSIGTDITVFPDLDFSFYVTNVTVMVYPESDHLLLSCFIYDTPPSKTTLSNNFRISVDAEIVAIVPEIMDVDISSYHIGSQVTIGCPIDTCAEVVQVQFFKGDAAVGEGEILDEMTESSTSVYNLVLPVTEDIVGNYTCKVDTSNPYHSTMEEFSIVGTPLPAISTPEPTDDSTAEPTTRKSHTELLAPSLTLTLTLLLPATTVWLWPAL